MKVFLFEQAIKISKNAGINKYAIKLEKNKLPFYKLIYSLGLNIRIKKLKNIKQNLFQD